MYHKDKFVKMLLCARKIWSKVSAGIIFGNCTLGNFFSIYYVFYNDQKKINLYKWKLKQGQSIYDYVGLKCAPLYHHNL